MRRRYRAFSVALILVAGSGLYLTRSPKKVAPVAPVVVQHKYVALGDSIASGEGLPSPSDSSACDRSDEAYPTVVAHALKLELKSFACTGATLTKGVLGAQGVNNLNVDSQVTQLFSVGDISLVTLTVGANDIGWVSMLSKCYTIDCGSTDDSAQLASKTTVVVSNLIKTLDILKNQPKIFVTGYYQLVPASSKSCDTILGISDREAVWIRQQDDALNKAIAGALTGYNNAHFVQPDFSGHEICTKDAWVQGLQDKAPFHPNSAGQNAIGQAIVTAFNANL